MKICKYCSQKFDGADNKKFCSIDCKNAYHNEHTKRAYRVGTGDTGQKIVELEDAVLSLQKNNDQYKSLVNIKFTEIAELKKQLETKTIQLLNLQNDLNTKETFCLALKNQNSALETKVKDLETQLGYKVLGNLVGNAVNKIFVKPKVNF